MAETVHINATEVGDETLRGIPQHDTRLTITIPFPSYIPRARGIHAVGKFGTIFKAKCTVAEKEMVQQAAALLGISPTELIRWSATKVAQEVLNDVPSADHST